VDDRFGGATAHVDSLFTTRQTVDDWGRLAPVPPLVVIVVTKHEPRDYLGRGLYTLPQAARLLGANVNSLKWWTGDREGSEPVVAREFADEGIVTFAELMELHFVKLFRGEGLSLQTIRKCAARAATRFQTRHPFSVKRFDTDGRDVFATLIDEETDREIVQELVHGQLVFPQIIRPFFRKLDYRREREVERFWPLDKKGRIVLDPLRRFGAPIDCETGMPVETIVEALNAGDGQDARAVARWFDIPLEAVEAARQFESSLAA
jgi:uncharacterized protein (DUF433 family)